MIEVLFGLAIGGLFGGLADEARRGMGCSDKVTEGLGGVFLILGHIFRDPDEDRITISHADGSETRMSRRSYRETQEHPENFRRVKDINFDGPDHLKRI